MGDPTRLLRRAPAEHGTTTRYQKGCRCDRCTARAAAYLKRVRYLTATGRWQPWGDLEAVRAHIARHAAQGCGAARLADAAGVTRETVWRIVRGEAKKITRATAERILATNPAPLPGAKVPAHGARRRLQALSTLGYTHAELAKRIGVSRPALARVSGGADRTTAAVAAGVARVYEELSMRPAPESRSARIARGNAEKQGWLPPLAWDDEWLDLPEEELAAVTAAQAADMDNGEVQRAYAARQAGDRSPLIVAAAEEFLRRRQERRRARARRRSAA